MSEVSEIVQRIEAALAAPGESSRERARSRRAISVSLQELASIEMNPSRSVCDALEAIAAEGGRAAAHALDALTIRLMDCPAILSPSDLDEARRHIIRLIEAGCPDLVASTALLDNRAQSHERLEAYQRLHSRACEGLTHLLHPFASLQDLSGHRQLLMKALNHGPSKRYLNTFGFALVLSSVSSLLKLVDDVVDSQGHELQHRTQSLLESVADDISQYETVPTFIARDYMCPFLNLLEKVTRASQAKMAAEFACSLTAPESPYELEKKYPLHVANSTIRVLVPMTNPGPGAALDVRAYYLTDSGDSEAQFGDVQPGPFVLDLHVNIGEARERLHLEVEVHWRTVGDPREHTVGFSVGVLGQRTDLDWDDLSLQQPYSLEVAYDQEFYGRKDAVRRLLRGLAPNRMQSCYITGQKRVGKSSLAHAVKTRLLDTGKTGKYRVLYRECGEFRHSSGEETLRALGEQLEEFFCQSLPPTIEWKGADYSSSLTYLNRLLEQLWGLAPELRFVVVLDEFDEINEALYRYGELASTFFLNLRTLSSKRNLAFVLVGAERMPYVMTSQGEKLNKFAQESLNSFDLATEWPDYQDLVRKPVGDAITFHEAAVRELFEITDGHPYFTKMLCGKIFELAVETKDAEVSRVEVRRAVDRVLRALDTNAFAHYWRDGTRGDAEEVGLIQIRGHIRKGGYDVHDGSYRQAASTAATVHG